MAKLAPEEILKQVIELDFGKFWPHCSSKKLKIATILNARRWGLSYKSLPEEVPAILRSPEVREVWEAYIEQGRTLQPHHRWKN